jgi:outer membrane lipoprotein-sorting protein
MFAFALALAVGPGAPPADAERLLAEVDGRITAAKTLRIEFEIRRTEKRDEPPLKGSLVLGTDNRLRYEMTGWMTASVVSDGKQLVTVVVSPAERKAQPMPEWFGDTLRAWLGRGGRTWPPRRFLSSRTTRRSAGRGRKRGRGCRMPS